MSMKQLDVDKVHEAIDITIQALHEKENQMRDVEVAINNFINLEDAFRGQGGQAIRDFYASCHLPFIQFFRLFMYDYKHTLKHIKQSLDFVEPSAGGFIDQAFIENDVQDGLDRVSKTTMSLTDSVNDTLRSIQDIISIPLIDDSDVQQAIHVAKREANATVDKVLQFDHMGTASLLSIKESLRTLGKYVMEMHGAMDNGHLSVKGFSIDQLQHLPTHGTLTEVLEERSSEVTSMKRGPKGKGIGTRIDRPTVSHKRLAKKETWLDRTALETYSGFRATFETVGNLATGTVDFFKDNPAEGISMAADFTPGISNVKSGFEAIFGFDPVTGRELEAWEQALAAAGVIGGPIADSVKYGARGIKHGDDLVDMAKGIDNGASVSKGTSNTVRLSDKSLDHANVGDFTINPKTGKISKMSGGGHGQDNIDFLKQNGIQYNIEKVHPNGVRIGNVPDHKSKGKRTGTNQAWFPENWSKKDIKKAGEHVINMSEHKNIADGVTVFGDYNGVRVGVIKTNGEIGTIFPDSMQP
ncbi:EndoU domain-containing protein [Salipaludibacillus agaradhaerens]|uniref:EndoU domain-containing protein n=1 Tax=Salipaludibacillus agaradhaerens TaxID=76935 RepID=A0A9Q4B425_SALAG|nr:T7SS effector LXG polymorphic toxin [Salipaludibacillus agaradhaerens]MCR6097760.1 EndoU domain-containing protein [Salipaludibacillus agaradhaerens]MCR6112756.1 EndoU domain-containing protein [Salipaludibacillus agaradhaerens]